MIKQFFILMAILPSVILGFHPLATSVTTREQSNENQSVVDDRYQRIDSYFVSHKMKLAGYGYKFIEEADKNNIDWRLLPAISIKESSGGNYQCHHNPFGYGSCKIGFKSIEEAIEVVSKNLGGNNPNTKAYYNGDTYKKLYFYNGTVEKEYPDRVLKIMSQF